MTKNKIAALYIRGDNPSEIMAQALELMTFARNSGYEVDYDIYRDFGNVHEPLERPGLKRLLTNSSYVRFDVVLATSPDRVYRSIEEWYEIEFLLNKKPIIYTNGKKGINE